MKPSVQNAYSYFTRGVQQKLFSLPDYPLILESQRKLRYWPRCISSGCPASWRKKSHKYWYHKGQNCAKWTQRSTQENGSSQKNLVCKLPDEKLQIVSLALEYGDLIRPRALPLKRNSFCRQTQKTTTVNSWSKKNTTIYSPCWEKFPLTIEIQRGPLFRSGKMQLEKC